jgi:outer membrane protein
MTTAHFQGVYMSKIMNKATVALLAAATTTSPVYAKAGDIFMHVRGILVAPNEKAHVDQLPTEKLKVSNSVMPEIDFTYMATDNVGFELIAATTKHHADGVTGTTGGIGRIASTWVLPPTLTVKFFPTPDAAIRPYVGAGINYTIFYSTKPSAGLVTALGPTTKVHMKDSVGWAAQAGVDIDLNEKMFLNLDLKYIDMTAKTRIMVNGAPALTSKININPIVAGVGIGFRM